MVSPARLSPKIGSTAGPDGGTGLRARHGPENGLGCSAEEIHRDGHTHHISAVRCKLANPRNYVDNRHIGCNDRGIRGLE